MRILLSNHHLHTIGGSETALYALAVEFKRLGHVVEYFTFHKGLTSQRLEAAGVTCTNAYTYYDLGIFSHNTTVKDRGIDFGTTVNVCHGTIPDLEQPAPGCDYYVGISEEVCNHLLGKDMDCDYENIQMIRNGVDMDRFHDRDKSHPEIVVSLCQSTKANNVIRRAATSIGKTLIFISHLLIELISS